MIKSDTKIKGSQMLKKEIETKSISKGIKSKTNNNNKKK